MMDGTIKMIVRMEAERQELLRRIAERDEVSMAAVIRRAIRELSEREGQSFEGELID